MTKLFILIFFLFSFSNSAFAYLGPGIGGGLIAATIGVVVSVFAALFGLIWFTGKKLLKKRKQKKEREQNKID